MVSQSYQGLLTQRKKVQWLLYVSRNMARQIPGIPEIVIRTEKAAGEAGLQY